MKPVASFARRHTLRRCSPSSVLSGSIAALTLLVTALVATSHADTLPLSLNGETEVNVWGAGSLSGAANSGFGGFPGTGAWPNPIQSPIGGDAFVIKVDNQNNAALGTGLGGAFPSGAGIYFGGFGTVPNTDGGTLGVVDSTPLANLQTVNFQIQIGQSYGYDLLNNDLSLVKLKYTTGTGSGTLSSTFGSLLNRFFNGSVDMPTGPGGAMQPEDIYVNLWGLQWDLSSIPGITSLEIQFTGVEHASLTQLQLDQSSAAYSTSAFPADAIWNAVGSNANWSTLANWNGGVAPTAGQSVTLAGAGSAIVDSNQTVGILKFNAANGFAVHSSNGAALSVMTGINAVSASPASYTIQAPLNLQGFNLIDLAAGNNLTIAGPISGAGFYKQGLGSLTLTGNNVYDGNNTQLATNGLIVRGGTNYLSGTNTLTGTGNIDFKIRQDTTVVLKGGDNVLDSKFAVHLLAASSKLVLGDANGKSDLTVAGLAGTIGTSVVTGSQIVGGSGSLSTLTVDLATGESREFGGNLGGAGANENNLALTKQGAGTQILSGANTFSGATRIEGGMLEVRSATALSANSNVQLAGGVLSLGSANFTANLGTGPGQVQFTGSGGFAASGGDVDEGQRIPRTVTLNGGAELTWGSGGFVGNGHKLILGHVAATNNVELTNAIALGGQIRTVQVDNSATESSIDGQLGGELSGSGGLRKMGAGILQLTATNSYTGETEVREGSLVLGGATGAVRGDIRLAVGTVLRLSNSDYATAYFGDRVADTATIRMKGANLTVNQPGTAEGATYTETIGTVRVEEGANIISTARNGLISGTPDGIALILGSLVREAGSTVHFAGAQIGVDVRNQVILGTAPTLDDGIIGPWATTGTGTASAATEFVSYNATYGLTALASYTNYTAAVTNDSTWTTASNIKINASASNTGFTSTLAAGRQINSLNMLGARGGTVGNVLNLGGGTLRVESGGIIVSGGASTRTTKITNGTLTAGTGTDAGAELVITATGNTDIGAAITNNGTGVVSLVKAGTSTLTLTGANTYTGDTYVNQGILNVNGANSGGDDLEVRKGASLNVNGSFMVGGDLVVDGSIGGTGAIVFGTDAKLSGAGTFNLPNQTLTIGDAVGQLATISPGNSPGQLNTGKETWAGGGTYLWEIQDASAGLGLGWDFLNITGTLNITASSSAPFVLELSSLAPTGLFGPVANFDSGSSYSWTIATASGGITGFDASDFIIDTSSFTGAPAPAGSFTLTQEGNNLALNYAVPEPSSAIFICSAGLWFLGRRRRAALQA